MAPVVVLVLGLHAVLLATPVRSARTSGNASASMSLQVRTLATAAVTAPTLAQAPVAVHHMNARAAKPVQPVAEPTPSVTETQSALPLVPELPAELAPPMPVFGLIVPGIDRDDDYFPRALLTLAPSPIEPVLIEYPVIDRDPGHHSSELTLFIDETGRVARVRVDGSELPFELEAAARNAFINARFRSGELDGRAVKSQIRIEVVFDGRSGNA